MAKKNTDSKLLAHTVLVLLAITFIGLCVVAFRLHPVQANAEQTQYAQLQRGPSQPARVEPAREPVEEQLDAVGTAVRLLEMVGEGQGDEAYRTYYAQLDQLEQKLGVKMVDVMQGMGEICGHLESYEVEAVQQFPTGTYGPETEVTMDCEWENTGSCQARIRLYQNDAGKWLVVSTFMIQ